MDMLEETHNNYTFKDPGIRIPHQGLVRLGGGGPSQGMTHDILKMPCGKPQLRHGHYSDT